MNGKIKGNEMKMKKFETSRLSEVYKMGLKGLGERRRNDGTVDVYNQCDTFSPATK